MRSNRGKATIKTRLHGDEALAERMAGALALQERDLERATHGFHTYPASLHPGCAAELLDLFDGDVVYDPFMGGGTVLVEAMLAGRTAIGRDLGPTSLRVARARTSLATEEDLTRMRSVARRAVEQARVAPLDPPSGKRGEILRAWYAPWVLQELETIRAAIVAESGTPRALLDAVFSSILIKCSWQQSDSSSRRVKHRRPKGTTAVLFHKKARELGRRIASFRESVPIGTPPADLGLANATESRVASELVITSPPYPGVYDYLPMQRLRAAWFRDPLPQGELGSRRAWTRDPQAAYGRWLSGHQRWIRRVAANNSGTIVVVIGDGRHDGRSIDTFEPTVSALPGRKILGAASLLRPDPADRKGRWEHVMALGR